MKVVVVCHNLVFKLVDGRTFSLISLKMKFFNVGDNFDNLNIELKAAKQGNKFGTLLYGEKIRLATVNPVADYNVWTSKDGNLFLCIRFESGIRDNLIKIVDLIKR